MANKKEDLMATPKDLLLESAAVAIVVELWKRVVLPKTSISDENELFFP